MWPGHHRTRHHHRPRGVDGRYSAVPGVGASAGYLGISHWTWCDRIAATRPHRCAFWRRDTKRFSAIEPGSPFFFLRKQEPNRRITAREVIGRAEFRTFETRAVGDLWGCPPSPSGSTSS